MSEKQDQKKLRQQKREAALRANLQRRKQQARARSDETTKPKDKGDN